MLPRIVITGIGVSIGAESLLKALVEGISRTHIIKSFDIQNVTCKIAAPAFVFDARDSLIKLFIFHNY